LLAYCAAPALNERGAKKRALSPSAGLLQPLDDAQLIQFAYYLARLPDRNPPDLDCR
jgi:hypothetical protein